MRTIALQGRDGACAKIASHGAQVVSWQPAGGDERLFLSERSACKAGSAIRGGIPVIFPQFGNEGPLPKHGFGRHIEWAVARVDRDGSAATFRLADSADTRTLWPHTFVCELRAAIAGAQLRVSLSVVNGGRAPLRFTAALHSYLLVDDVSSASVLGLGGLRYRDSADNGIEKRQSFPAVRFSGEVDRIYFDAPAKLQLHAPRALFELRQSGFADTVVWNPGAGRAAAIDDLAPDGWRRFACIEAAAVGRPIALAAGERWCGTQTLIAG